MTTPKRSAKEIAQGDEKMKEVFESLSSHASFKDRVTTDVLSILEGEEQGKYKAGVNKGEKTIVKAEGGGGTRDSLKAFHGNAGVQEKGVAAVLSALRHEVLAKKPADASKKSKTSKK